MKKWIKKICISIALSVLAVWALLVCSFLYPPAGKVIFSFCFGQRYTKVGETVLEVRPQPQTLSIYRAPGKPFLLLGPCVFSENEPEDFFFVNHGQVICSAADKGGDMWVRFFNRLYIMDDLSDCERLRAPLWSELKSVQRGTANGVEVYTFQITSMTKPAQFSIPAKFFTVDMLTGRD